VFLDQNILFEQDDIIENFLELWMEVKGNIPSDLSENVLFIANQAVYAWKDNAKKAKLTSVNITQDQDFIYFKNIDFDITFLFQLQQNFTQSIVEIFNYIYSDFCIFMNKKNKLSKNPSTITLPN
jgi:hypothetical protein